MTKTAATPRTGQEPSALRRLPVLARKVKAPTGRRMLTVRAMPESEADWTPAEQVQAALFGIPIAVLTELLTSDMTVAELARIELASRGVSETGAWLQGMAAADRCHGIIRTR